MLRIICLISVVGLSMVAAPKITVAQSFSISWYTFDAGGGDSIGAAFEIVGTIGQHDSGAVMSGGSFTLAGGFWSPDEQEILLGDVNQDGLVNLLDVGPFVQLLTTGEFQTEADINQDGIVNLLDVDPFVALLAGG